MMWRAAFFLGRHNEQSVAPMDGLVTAPIVEAFLRENARYAILPGSVAPLRATLDAYERRGSRVVLVLAPYHSAVLRYRFARGARSSSRRKPRSAARFWTSRRRYGTTRTSPIRST